MAVGWWIIAGVVGTLCAVPLILANPMVGAIMVAVAGGWWLFRLGSWRASYALLLFFTLGATSVVEPWVTISLYARPVMLAALIVATVQTTREVDRRPLRGLARWVLYPLYGMVLLALVSTLWSPDWTTTLLQAGMLGGLVVLLHLLITRRWTDRATMVGDLRVSFYVVSVVFVLGILADIAGLLEPTWSGRFQGLLNNPNLAAQLAVLIFFLGLGLFLEHRAPWRLAWLVPAFVTVLLAESRTVTLALAAGILIITLRTGMRGLLVFGAGCLAAIVAVLVVGPGPLGSVIARFGDTAGGDALAGRLTAWDNTFMLIGARPTGYGWGVTDVVLTGAYDSGQSQVGFVTVHNSFLQVTLELGVLGVALLVVSLGAVGVRLFVGKAWGIEIGLIALVTAGGVVMWAESSVFGTGQSYPYLFWPAVAGLLAVNRSQQQSESVAGLEFSSYRR